LEGKKVPFIAQFNLAEFPVTHRLLPADGHLFAFVLSDNDYAHRPPPTTVFLYRGPAESLVRAVRPMDDEEVFLDAADDGVYDVVPATATPAPGVEEAPEDAALGQFFGEMQDYYGTPPASPPATRWPMVTTGSCCWKSALSARCSGRTSAACTC
jgi:hypothetical protein